MSLAQSANRRIRLRRSIDLARTVGVVTAVAVVAQLGIELGTEAWLDVMLFGSGAPPPEAIATSPGALSVEVGLETTSQADALIREAAHFRSVAVAAVWMLAAGAAVLLMREELRPRVLSEKSRPGVAVSLSPSAT